MIRFLISSLFAAFCRLHPLQLQRLVLPRVRIAPAAPQRRQGDSPTPTHTTADGDLSLSIWFLIGLRTPLILVALLVELVKCAVGVDLSASNGLLCTALA